MTAPLVRVLIGPTASGKARLAALAATALGCDIISMDSMKVYRGMDIGTAKPSAETRQRVRFHLIDMVEPDSDYSVAAWAGDAVRIIHETTANGGIPLVAGGTALYYKALTEGLFKGPGSDPAIRARLRAEATTVGVRELHRRLSEVDPVAAGRILPGDLKRIERALEVYELTGKPISSFQTQFGAFRADMRFMVLGLQVEREHAYEMSDKRVDRMLKEGLAEEARGLFERYPVLGPTAAQAVGYKEFYAHFRGECSLAEAIELVKRNTRHLARRQFMWFRKFTGVTWVQVERGDNADSLYSRAKEQYPQFFDPAYRTGAEG